MKSQNKIKPKVISTFSGCGGSSMGYHLAGYDVLMAVEMDNHAAETYKLNFPDTIVYHGDIHDLTIDEILEKTKLKPGELDLFDGSPPCQGFSMIGKREYCDPKNQLYNEYIRLLRGLKPKTFVMENVKGLVIGKMKLIFKDILTELKNSGYDVQVKLMNAKYYNCATERERLIFIGVREDLGIPASHPNPQTRPISIQSAIGHLEGKYTDSRKYVEYAKYLRQGEKSGNIPDFPTRERDIRRCKQDQPCPTITRKRQLIHYKENRRLTIEEESILQSFTYKDNNFKWVGSDNQIQQRIGNSVPPNLMKAIAQHIKKEILEKID